MEQTATLYILEIKDLKLLQYAVGADPVIKKSLLALRKKKPDSFAKKLEEFAVEKIKYRWSGLAFAILAVFSKEKLGVDWDYLKYNSLANELSEKTDAGIYIFSINDKVLMKLKPNGFFYSLPELNRFAFEFAGNKPGNQDIMTNAAEALDKALSKLTKEKVVLLLIE